MKKLLFFGIFALTMLGTVSGMAYIIAVGGKYDIGGDLYGCRTIPNSTTPFVWGQPVGNLTPVSYPSAHLILGYENGALDIGVGMAGDGVIPISLGGLVLYGNMSDMIKAYGGGEILYYVIPGVQGWTFLTLNSKIFGIEISFPLLPVSAFAGVGLRFPLVFGPNDYFSFAVGWTAEFGGRFYLMK